MNQGARTGKPIRRAVRVVAVLACAGLAAGCSSTPDWANPVEWYRGAVGWFDSSEPSEADRARERARAERKTSAGTGEPYPSLATVPERPAELGTQREQVQQGLAADRARARYDQANPAAARTPSPATAPAMTAPTGAPPPPPPPPAAGGAQGGTAPKTPISAPIPQSQPQPRPQQTASVAAPPPRAPAPQAAAQPPSDADGVRAAFEAALSQSAATVTTAPAGLRDMNHSPVLSPPVRVVAPVPPPVTAPQAGVKGAGVSPFDADTAGAQVAMIPPGRAPYAVVYFANASSEISGQARNDLEKIANLHKERGGTVHVVGHASSRTRNTDQVSHQIANFRVSLERANAVAAALARLGVPADRIAVSARADNEPVYYEVMPAGEAGNRRAEIFLDY